MKAKRARWATQFEDDDELFIDHTLLVNSAVIIARVAVGSTIVVEPDCFDWLGAVPGGDAFTSVLASRLGSFDWETVEHDVLKHLYESVITPRTRKQLGEYYTPDWLAEKIAADTIDDPLAQRMLDPACGSGTFLFHAVRRHLAAAAGLSNEQAIASVTKHVRGMDVHPVAVALARVTYLLAIGRARLAHLQGGPIYIPVELGDALARNHVRDRVDVLIGNPPWIAYRHMSKPMQDEFKRSSEAMGLWAGAKVATHQDLSALFTARSIELHLRVGGRFAFVVPNATLDRDQYSGFRTGRFDDVHVAFDRPWDLRRLRPHFFPRAAAVVFGRRAEHSEPMPIDAEVWTGRIPSHVASWASLEPALTRTPASLAILDADKASPYQDRFRQGATVVPRMLFLIRRCDDTQVRSVRTRLEKPPWRDLPALEGSVEPEFIVPLYLGEHVLPYRATPPAEAVIPWHADERRLLRPASDPLLDSHPQLAKWWRNVGEIWDAHRSSERLSITEQLDYHSKLSSQYPVHPERIVYAASGMHLCAARIDHPRAVIEHGLYWSSVESIDEARYLCAVLNAACITELVRPHMAYGKDERHIDKHVWKLPIPRFDADDPTHVKIAEQAAHLEAVVARLELDDHLHFSARRRRVRELLALHPIACELESMVAELV